MFIATKLTFALKSWISDGNSHIELFGSQNLRQFFETLMLVTSEKLGPGLLPCTDIIINTDIIIKTYKIKSAFLTVLFSNICLFLTPANKMVNKPALQS